MSRLSFKYINWFYFIINFLFQNVLSKYYILKKNKNNNLQVGSLNKNNIKFFINSKNDSNSINTILDKKMKELNK